MKVGHEILVHISEVVRIETVLVLGILRYHLRSRGMSTELYMVWTACSETRISSSFGMLDEVWIENRDFKSHESCH
jgi:hypothetical protein